MDCKHMNCDYSNHEVQPKLNCVGDTLSAFREDEFIFIPLPFFTKIPKHQYIDALQRLLFPDPVVKQASQFIKEKINGPYVGVHMRWLEGTCYQCQKNIFIGERVKYLKEALLQCDMKWSYLSQKIRDEGYDPEKVSIFLASDNQRPELVRDIVAHKNVVVWDSATNSGVDGRMMDLALLSGSSLFIGNPYSSFTFHVALWREIKGFDSKTNILAGYQEIGFLNHLF